MNPSWMQEIVTIGRGVIIAVTPLVLLFLLFQVFLLRLPLKQVADVLKGVLIVQDFMEMRHAPALWRRLVLGWLYVVVGLITVAWLAWQHWG